MRRVIFIKNDNNAQCLLKKTMQICSPNNYRDSVICVLIFCAWFPIRNKNS